MKIIAVLVNFLLPGIGSFMVGRGGAGVAQLLLFGMGLLLVLTFFLAPFGFALMGVAWIWGLITAATASNKPTKVIVIERK